MAAAPRKAVLLARLSDVRDDDDRGVEGQVQDGCEYASRIGWAIGPRLSHVIIENTETGEQLRGVSAFKRKRIQLPDGRTELRTVRPGFRRALAMLADGRADGLLAIDLDRAMRDPRDLEDLVDLVEQSSPRIPVESLTGSLRLANDADVTMARVMVAIANKASRDTARRVAAARKHQAHAGEYSASGTRPYGFERDGVTIREDEAAEIRKWADALLDGAPVRQITADLRRRGVATVTGTSWKPTTVREVLRRPRCAGLLVYRGEEVGKAPWPPILPEDIWRAVCAILEDPARRSTPGNTPKWLLSGLALCGACKQPVHVWGQSRGRTAYRCPNGGHVQRAAARLDEFVTAVIVARLARPDAIDLLKPHSPAPDVAALRREVATLRARLDEQARLHARGLIDGAQLAAGSAELRGRLDSAERDLSATAQRSPLDGLAGRPDAADVWASLSLGIRRAALAELCTVVLQPAYHGRLPGGGYLDPSAVRFDWNE